MTSASVDGQAVLSCLTRAHQGSAREPMYHRLAAVLERDVRDGALPAGTSLPPEVQIAGHLRVSRGTVRQALRLLEHRHVLVRPPASGSRASRARVADPDHLLEENP